MIVYDVTQTREGAQVSQDAVERVVAERVLQAEAAAEDSVAARATSLVKR